MKKKIQFLVFCLIVFGCFIKVEASSKWEGIENFPISYQGYLLELQRKHPNWTFSALYTNLDWNYVINQENVFGKNLVPKSYADRWKNTKPGEYNVEVDKGWVDASRQAVEYSMDPRNFLNEVRLFQFEALNYNATTNQKQAIEKILYGTEFYECLVSYRDHTGKWTYLNETYADLILEAARTSKVSAFHLASRIKQEVGPFLSHSSISGIVEGFEGLYNFYNIGATSSAEPMGAIKNGLRYAKDGNGASQQTKDQYQIPWNTKPKAITGGGIFIGSSYINIGQYTIYLQKFDVNDEKKSDLFWHQYMTNVLAPYSEARSIYQGYEKSNLLDLPLHFTIPVYQNMPKIPTESPNINPNDFTQDETKVYANVSGSLNVRSGPGTSYEVVTSIDRNQKLTRIAKGKQKGELWDRVQLENGIIGYVFQNYLEEIQEEVKPVIEKIEVTANKTKIAKQEKVKLQVTIFPEEAKNEPILFHSSRPKVASVNEKGEVQGLRSGTTTITVSSQNKRVTSTIDIQVYTPVTDLYVGEENITLAQGMTKQLFATVYPEDADEKTIQYAIQDTSIATIDDTGKITAKKEGSTKITVQTAGKEIKKQVQLQVTEAIQPEEIVFNPNLSVQGNQISGLDSTQNTVEWLLKQIQTNWTIKVYDFKGNVLSNQNKIGTGSKIQIWEEDQLRMEYEVVLYGDANGDGKIDSVDLLILQRHILEITPVHGIFLKAGNVRKNGKNVSSIDLLLIQRHILELQSIIQKEELA